MNNILFIKFGSIILLTVYISMNVKASDNPLLLNNNPPEPDMRNYNLTLDVHGFNRGTGIHFRTGTKFDEEGYDKYGFRGFGDDNNKYTKTKYDENGFNIKGIHKDTLTEYSKAGFDREGYDANGYGTNGYRNPDYPFAIYSCLDNRDLTGVIIEALTAFKYFDEDGIHKDTGTRYNKEGFDIKGTNKDTLTKFDNNGFDRHGFDRHGYDKNGYDEDGFNKKGINTDTGNLYGLDSYDTFGYDKDGYNNDGFNKEGRNKDTGTYYALDGYDKDGHDRGGYDMYGKKRTFNFISTIEDVVNGQNVTKEDNEGFTVQINSLKQQNDNFASEMIVKVKLLKEELTKYNIQDQVNIGNNELLIELNELVEIIDKIQSYFEDIEEPYFSIVE